MWGFRAPAASPAVMRMVRQRRLVPVMRHGARTRSATFASRCAKALEHMMDAATRAIGYAQGRSRQDLDQDELLRLALTKLADQAG
jgi:hypothetical protein